MEAKQSGDALLLDGKLGTWRLDSARACENLAMFPLIGTPVALEGPGYQLLEQALAAGTARITEISTAGSVPELQFENSGTEAVLLLDGEELIGAKQNRILNLSVLAPPGQVIRIPVSCVEAGRWSHQTAEFAAAPRAHYAAGRAKKAAAVSANLRTTGARHSDQGEVWADIAEKSARMRVRSSTSAMSELFERRSTALETFVQQLPALPGQVGALFVIGGRPASVDCFDHPATLALLLPKLVRSAALDALDAQESLGEASSTPADADPGAALLAAERFLHDLRGAQGERYPGVGLGEDWRFHTARLSGGALFWSDRMIHLSAFPIAREVAAPAAHQRGETRLARPSRRARRE